MDTLEYIIVLFVLIIILVKLFCKKNIEKFKLSTLNNVLTRIINSILVKENTRNIKDNIIKVIDILLIPKKKYMLLPFLKLLNTMIVSLPENEKKKRILYTRLDIVEYFAKKGHDVNCIIDLNFCSKTELSGISGFLATKSKLLISKNKEYKSKLEGISKIIRQIHL
jgi:hypothetical protein